MHQPPHTPPSPHTRCCNVSSTVAATALTLAIALLAQAAPAHAQDANQPAPHPNGYSDDPNASEFDAYSPYYNGAFLALGAFAGPTYTTENDAFANAWTTAFGALAQYSTPLQVIDLQASWLHSDLTTTLTDGRDLAMTNDAFGMSVGLHPFFLIHLESEPLYYVLGGTYLLAGADLEWIRADAGGDTFSEWDSSFHFGAGLDIPLDDVDDGGALWLGAQYRYNTWDLESEPLRQANITQHLILVRLSYRHNGLLIPL